MCVDRNVVSYFQADCTIFCRFLTYCEKKFRLLRLYETFLNLIILLIFLLSKIGLFQNSFYRECWIFFNNETFLQFFFFKISWKEHSSWLRLQKRGRIAILKNKIIFFNDFLMFRYYLILNDFKLFVAFWSLVLIIIFIKTFPSNSITQVSLFFHPFSSSIRFH